jgi:SAM-dependent methyltransferase
MQTHREPGGSASRWGPLFGARARDWAETWEGPHGWGSPVYAHVLERAQVGPGTELLDCGCGAGRFARMACDRGARVAGIDAAARLIEIAARQVPDGDFRVGDLEALPWPDRNFDLVAGLSAFQFADERRGPPSGVGRRDGVLLGQVPISRCTATGDSGGPQPDGAHGRRAPDLALPAAGNPGQCAGTAARASRGDHSVGMNFLLHCLPGDWPAKGAVFANAATAVRPGGRVFGSTILADGAQTTAPARALMRLYNSRGIFHNAGDDLAGLGEELASHFADHRLTVHGCVALFEAHAAPHAPNTS